MTVDVSTIMSSKKKQTKKKTLPGKISISKSTTTIHGGLRVMHPTKGSSTDQMVENGPIIILA